jgi:RNA polymerase sigma factor for flagellar operon FliA
MMEIGLTLGVVESRVSQIHSTAVLRLRTALAALQKVGPAQHGKGPEKVRGEGLRRKGGMRA